MAVPSVRHPIPGFITSVSSERPVASGHRMLYKARDVRVQNICTSHGISPYDPELRGTAPLWRALFTTRAFGEWVGRGLRAVQASSDSSPLPRAQLEAELEGFVTGKSLSVDRDFHCLEDKGHCVWQLKTPDLRLFGWFVDLNVMILHAGADANVLHAKGWVAYKPYVDEIVAFRSTLGPDLPGPLTGERASDVVSTRPRQI